MNIKNIEWISAEAREVVLSIGNHEFQFKAFACPFAGELEDGVQILHTLFARDVYLVQGDPVPKIVPAGSGFFSAEIIGQVVSSSPPIVCVADLQIELDLPLPGDVEPGQWVEFTCTRLDLF